MINLNEILLEVSYKTSDGSVNWKNKEHVSILTEILIEEGYGHIVSELIANLTEAQEDGNDKEKEPENKEDDKYVHIGGSAFVKKSDYDDSKETAKDGAQHYKKTNSGGYVAMSDSEYEKEKNAQGEMGSDNGGDASGDYSGDGVEDDSAQQQAAIKSTYSDRDYQNKIDMYDKAAKEDYENSLPSKGKIEATMASTDVIILKRVKRNIEASKDVLSTTDRSIAKNCFTKTAMLFRDDVPDTEKVRIANELKHEYKISTNSGQTKYYINALGKNRKLFGNGTKGSAHLVDQIKKYAQLDQVNLSSMKNDLTAVAKPDLGKEFEVKPDSDSRVKQLFSSDPVLGRIREAVHGVFAPKDMNGEILFPSNQHTREYLKQSFENPALDNTIETARKYVDKGQLSPSYLKGLETHKERLSNLLSSFDVPSDELSESIADSYNELMVDLNEADPESASAVMKQLAENRLYETELARGNEVYLPSNGTFPGGDIIRRDGKVGRVALVSCKFGKTGRIYGCPANMKAVSMLHPDEDKRELFGQYVGEKDHTLMVRDDLVAGSTREETTGKIKRLISDSLVSQNIGNTFSEDDINKIGEITSEYYYKLTSTREKLKTKLGKVPAAQFWGEFQKELSKFKGEFGKQIQEVATQEKMEHVVGSNNAKAFKTRMTPDVFLSTVMLCENIRSGGGYGMEHNKQYYDEFGAPKYVTSKGTNNPDDYSLTIRNERTYGRSGGGIQMSFSGDGERPVGEIYN